MFTSTHIRAALSTRGAQKQIRISHQPLFNVALFAVAALSLLTPASVRAGAFFIDDTRADDNILFSANDFEGGIFIGNNLLQQGLNNPGAMLVPEAAAQGAPIEYPFHGQWINPTGTVPLAIQVAFLEPGTTIISDILYCEYQAGSLSSIQGFFISDTDTPGGLNPSILVPTVPVTYWDESLGAFDFSAPFLTASANSDFEVPEPASCWLLLLGLGALVGRRLARSRFAPAR